MNKGTLYLIPCTLGPSPLQHVIPPTVIEITSQLQFFVVEQAKTARQFLGQLPLQHPLQSLQLNTLNKHTNREELNQLLQPLREGHDVGILSEAGCPGIADPGADLVALAQQQQIRVIPLVGPSSILLALMASGLNGQCFAFHGYLPIEEGPRRQAIQQLERESSKRQQTQLFIETPFRNDKLFQTLLQSCKPDTRLCVATDITLESEQIYTRTIKQWQQQAAPAINKRPSIFLLLG